MPAQSALLLRSIAREEGAMRGGEHPYASALYAQALAGMGTSIAIPEWESFTLARPVPTGGGADAVGAYPLACLAPQSDVMGGLARLTEAGLVSVVLVPDPLRGPPRTALSEAFDMCRSFKTHQLIEAAADYAPTKHHRDRIRRGLRRCVVREVRLEDHLAEWSALYAELSEKRGIGGAAAFSEQYFAILARDERMTTFAAYVDDTLAAMTIWFAYDGVVYNHLTASNAQGYANGANFALYDRAIERFRSEGIINLGGGAGFSDDPQDGLAAFKRGFANSTVEALLCGAILDSVRYAALSESHPNTAYFPAYRG